MDQKCNEIELLRSKFGKACKEALQEIKTQQNNIHLNVTCRFCTPEPEHGKPFPCPMCDNFFANLLGRLSKT